MSDKVTFLWTSDNIEIVEKMLFMYTKNAFKHRWLDEITILVWGPSQKLIIEDKDISRQVSELIELGIKFYACKACSDSYGISIQLGQLNIDVKYMGVDFTNMIKGDGRILTI